MTPKTYKEIALDFLKLSSEGKPREAFRLYVSGEFKHHNAYFEDDAESLIIGMEENAKRYPLMKFDVLHVLQDGEFVSVHSRALLSKEDLEFSICHIFRFKENLIIELWDFAQQVPDNMVNENGMF